MEISTDFFNNDKIIKKLMAKERKKVKKFDRDESRYKKQRQAWSDIKKHMRILSRTAADICSPINSAFRQKTVAISDPKFFTATANKNAVPGKHHIEIIKIARQHKVQSDPLTQNVLKSKLPAATFEIEVGKKKVTVNFKGGTLRALTNAIRDAAKDLVTIYTLKVSDNDTRLILTAKESGNKYLLKLKGGDALLDKLGLTDTGGGNGGMGAAKITQKSFKDFLFKEVENLDNFKYEKTEKGFEIILGNKTGKQVLFKKAIEVPEKGKLTVSYKLQKKDTFKRLDIFPVIKGKIHSSGLLKIEKKRAIGFGFYGLDEKNQKVTRTFDLKQEKSGAWGTKTIDLDAEKVKKLTGLFFFNKGTGTVRFAKLRLPAVKREKGIHRFKNTITRPGNLEIKVNDIKITRSKNTVSEVITGVTLTALKPTQTREILEIKNNPKPALEKLEQFLSAYNAVIEKINLYNGAPRKDEKEKKMIGGEMRGDTTLMRMKYDLQSIIIDSYQTSQGDTLAMLSQLGIGTARAGTGYTKGAFVGTVKWIDGETEKTAKQRIQKALAEYPEAVFELLVNDANKDGMPDTGVAFRIRDRTQLYTRGTEDGQPNPTEGPIVLRIDTLIRALKYTENRRTRFDKNLKRKERSLRLKLGKMKGRIYRYRSKFKRAQQQGLKVQ